nr:MAG TPA: hypothetical protein [Caudoviricetes sp.]
MNPCARKTFAKLPRTVITDQSKRTAEAVPLLEGYAGGSHRLHAVYPACLA